jgi:uncharacterized Zn finger protein
VKITEASVRSFATTESFARGYKLFQSGAVYDTFRQENVITGKCEGNSAPYYHIRVRIDEGGIHESSCTCPYDWGGICKHIIALALTYIHNPDAFNEQKRVDELLAGLDKKSLVSLIDQLITEKPELYFWLQNVIETPMVNGKLAQCHSRRKTPVSQTEYRRQIQNILHSLDGRRRSEAYWMMDGMVSQLQDVRNTAHAFLNAGDADGALVILAALITEVTDRYDEFDDSDGELGRFLEELTLPLMEAILSADLSKSKRKQLEKELEPMVNDLSDIGIEQFDIILTALVEGWTVDQSIDLGEISEADSILVAAWLNVLERQGRLAEFLQICLETGQYLRYILKQIELGNYEQAVSIAWNNLTQADEALLIAKKLRDAGHLKDALDLAEKGLLLDGSKHILGNWLGPMEESLGWREKALQAYHAAFESLPSLELYQTLKTLGEKDWETMKPVLMSVFNGDRFENTLVDIYLIEEEWDAAIAVADRIGDWQYDLLEKVVDRVISFRQDWAIQACQKQAQLLISKTNSKYYAIAGQWLAKVKQAYLSSQRKAEWQAYLDGLKSTYSRRPALQAELRKL